jgi:hypothetical protein
MEKAAWTKRGSSHAMITKPPKELHALTIAIIITRKALKHTQTVFRVALDYGLRGTWDAGFRIVRIRFVHTHPH